MILKAPYESPRAPKQTGSLLTFFQFSERVETWLWLKSSGGSMGGARPPSLIIRPNWGPKNPRYLRVWIIAPPPSPYLKATETGICATSKKIKRKSRQKILKIHQCLFHQHNTIQTHLVRVLSSILNSTLYILISFFWRTVSHDLVLIKTSGSARLYGVKIICNC